MKLVFLPFLALMLCNFCSSTPTKDKNKANIFLPREIVMGILRELGLRSLFTSQLVDKVFDGCAYDVKNETIADYHIILEPIKNDEKNSSNVPCSINEMEKSIEFVDVRTFCEFVPKYGTRIRKLTFRNPNDPIIPISIDKWAEAHHIVYEHCSKYLQEFDMGRISDKKLKKIPMEKLKKFKNVEILKFVIEGEINKHKLSDLFPNVKDMDITLDCSDDFAFIDCKLKDLKVVQIYILSSIAGHTGAKRFIGLIKENPQIEHYKILCEFLAPDIRKAISKDLVDLKKLGISLTDKNQEWVSFGNVTDATLQVDEVFHIDSLLFPNLDSLKINYHPEKHDAFNTFFGRLLNLKELTFSKCISTSNFKQLTAGLLELETVKVMKFYTTEYNKEDLYNFIKHHPHLKTFIFPLCNENYFRNEFGTTWTIEIDGGYLFFIKEASNP